MTAELNTQHILKTKALIDDLKAVCANYGLGNDGNEFKIITQIFLYKYLNDKFSYELKKARPEWKDNGMMFKALEAMNDSEYKTLVKLEIEGDISLQPHQLLPYLFDRQNEPDFAKRLDETLLNVAADNNELYAVTTGKNG